MNCRLFKPMVMFFRLCNLPSMFQAMMDEIFKDMLMEGPHWLIIYMDDILIFADDEEDLCMKTQ